MSGGVGSSSLSIEGFVAEQSRPRGFLVTRFDYNEAQKSHDML